MYSDFWPWKKGTSAACSQKIFGQRRKLKKCFWKVFVWRNRSQGQTAFHFFVCGRHHVIWGRMRTYPGAWVRLGFIMNNPLIAADGSKVTRSASTHPKKEIQQAGVMPLSCDGQNNTFLTSSLSSSVPHENIWAVGFTRRETGWRTSQSESSLSDKEPFRCSSSPHQHTLSAWDLMYL